MRAVLVLVMACGSTEQVGADAAELVTTDAIANDCTAATLVCKHEYDCDGGRGVCVDAKQGRGLECVAKTSGCTNGDEWYRLDTDNGFVSFCYPPVVGGVGDWFCRGTCNETPDTCVMH